MKLLATSLRRLCLSGHCAPSSGGRARCVHRRGITTVRGQPFCRTERPAVSCQRHETDRASYGIQGRSAKQPALPVPAAVHPRHPAALREASGHGPSSGVHLNVETCSDKAILLGSFSVVFLNSLRRSLCRLDVIRRHLFFQEKHCDLVIVVSAPAEQQ